MDEWAKIFMLEKNIYTSKMILTAAGNYVLQKDGGILIVPLTCLGN